MEFASGGPIRGVADLDQQPFVTSFRNLAVQRQIENERLARLGPFVMVRSTSPHFALRLGGIDYQSVAHPRFGFTLSAPIRSLNEISMKRIPIDDKGNWVVLAFDAVKEEQASYGTLGLNLWGYQLLDIVTIRTPSVSFALGLGGVEYASRSHPRYGSVADVPLDPLNDICMKPIPIGTEGDSATLSFEITREVVPGTYSTF